MISLSLSKSFRNPNELSSGATASPAQPVAAAPALFKSGSAVSASPLPSLTKAELRAAAKGPSHKRRFGLGWLQIGRVKKRLETLETVSLGEKRFIALVRVDDRQFLIGGAPSSVGLLTELAQEESFHQVLNDATQGLNVSFNMASVAPTTSELQTEAALRVPTEVTKVEPPMASAGISSEALATSRDVSRDLPGSASRPVDEAFMQAYRDAALAVAAEAASTPNVPMNPLPSAYSNGLVPPELQVPQTSAASTGSSATKLQETRGPEPQPGAQALVLNESTKPVASASSTFSSAPVFTFQKWPASTEDQRQKPQPKASSKPAPLQVAGFTWSLTGATS